MSPARFFLTLRRLLQVTEPGGSKYRLTYDLAGRLDSVTVAPTGTATQGVREGRVYDADGRVIRRQRLSATLGQLNLDNLFYDARDKIVEAQTQSAAAGHANETTRLVYDDLGAVLASEVSNIGTWQAEEFRTDAMGHVTYRRPSIAVTGVGRPQWATYGAEGALTELAATNPGSPPPQHSFYPDASYSAFAVWGGVEATGQQRRVADLHFELEVASRQYADASNRLRVVQRYSWHGNAGGETYRDGTFEELRYDALGRRVLARARRDAGVLCGVTCASYVERTVWDGDQLLFEDRIPGGDALTNGQLDVGTGGPPHYGRVGYVHALGLDQPLGTTGSAPRVVNVNWRGLGESSVTAAGAAADCSVSGGGSCTTIPWPAGRGIYYGPVGNGTSAPPTPTFAGTLLLNGEGSSGLLYRRHRFFDPATGQFTQEDPIGLGGGVNVYGFAGGDPVNFSDPFGLCPQAVRNGTYCIDLFIQARRAGPLAGDGRGHNPNAPARQSRAQILVDPAGGTISSSVSPSCIIGIGVCGAPNGNNRITGTRGEHGSFSVGFALTNSFGGPDIDGTLTFARNGKGGWNLSHDISAFPSNGIYQRVNGAWVKAKPDHNETTPIDLIDGRGRDKSP